MVGVSGLRPVDLVSQCLVIDGAIASGATTIAIMELLRSATSSFRIFSVHATYEGLRAIQRYAVHAGLDLAPIVGHATAGLNPKYYAIDPEDKSRVVVGDLGETISDLDG